MTSPSTTYDPSLFAGVAHYYRQYRPRYTDELYRLLVKEFNLDGQGRLLDLATGTGLIAIALSAQFEEVVAIDADPEMLQEAQLEAERVSLRNIDWIQDQAENISSDLGKFRLITVGRAYHWFDKLKVLQLAGDRLITGGGIALTYTYEDIWHSTVPWKLAVLAVVKKWVGEKRRAGSGLIDNLDRTYDDLPELLEKTGFTAPFIHKIAIEKTWTIDNWLGYLYSTAFCRPAYLGESIKQFETDIRETLLAINSSGEFIEEIPVDVYLAYKI